MSVEIYGIKEESDFAEESHDGDGNIEIETIFKKPCCLESEEAISLSKSYILHMANGCGTENSRVAVSLSDFACNVYDVENHFTKVATIPQADDVICNIRFEPGNDNLLYVASADCIIKLWDLRQNKPVTEFKDKSKRKLASFDVSCNGRFLCGGTEVDDGDAFLLFWDARSSNLLGGYWDSHQDDITQVCFHPGNPDLMATGSTDGLINIFDVSLKTEADALQQTLNTESSIEKLSWHERKLDSVLSCITHTYDLQFWEQDGSSPYRNCSRTEIASSLKITEDDLYIASVMQLEDPEGMMVLGGSNAGKGGCLRSAVVTDVKLSPLSVYPGNKQIVRCCWYNKYNDRLITGGESGLLSLWAPGQQNKDSPKMKVNKKNIKAGKKPYDK